MTGRVPVEIRDILIKALANNADPCDARGVVSFALGSLSRDIWVAQSALGSISDGGMADFEGCLIALSERAKALQEFCDAFLDINFNTSKGGSE